MYHPLKYEATTENIVDFLNEFKCQRCEQSCCQRLDPSEGIALKAGEARVLAKNLGMAIKTFKKRYTFTRDEKRFMNTL